MSSAERDSALAGDLIERLLADPEFRAAFRRDPAAAALAAGLPDLADELTTSPGSIDPLAVRESRSSLAGVVMAVAVEGMSFAEAQALSQHGIAGGSRGLGKVPHGGGLRSPLGHVRHPASPAALAGEPKTPAGPAEPARAALGSPPDPASAASGSPPDPASAASDTPPGPASAASGTPPEPASGAPATAQPAPTPPDPASGTPATAQPAPTPPHPGAQPAHGGVVPAWPDQHPAAVAEGTTVDPPAAVGAGAGAGSPAAAMLDSPRLSAPPDVRALLRSDGADPRLVSVLNSALANHSIGLGQVTSLTEPVHVQAVSIVSVDGQAVGPSNFAARDLVTEIAALDPSLRPSEIGTPWPIHAQGFFSDPAQQAQLHLAFVSSADYARGRGSAVAAVPAPLDATPVAANPAAPVDAAPAAATPASDPNPSQYVNPLPASAHIGRTDMGVDADLNPGDPIVAPGTSRVLGIMPNWYQGQPYVALQLLDGPMKGHNYYVAEQITPDVSVGQIVQQGQPIARYASSGTGIEMGWAGSNWEQTLAQATSGYSEGEQTAAGSSFHDFLDGLGHHKNLAAAGAAPVGPGGAAPAGPGAAAPVAPVAAAPATPAPATPAAPAAALDAMPPHQPAPGPPEPAPFNVLGSHQHGARSHTVQFLPAVQPRPGSPLYDQTAARVAPAQPNPEAPAPPAATGGAPPPGAAALVDQASASAPTGGAISVSSSLLTTGQAKFAGRLSELTGLDPRVVAAWELAEESGGAAQAREAASNFNWLNIGYFDSGAGRIAFDKTFSDPVSAAEQSAKFLKGEWGGASPSIRAILGAVGHSAGEQMAAIANSDWASSHYGGGANLHGTYNELEDIRIEKSTVT